MIYAFSVIKGYNSLRGNLFIHFSMIAVMLLYVRIPGDSSWNRDDDEEDDYE